MGASWDLERVGGKPLGVGGVQDVVNELTPGVGATGVDDLVLGQGDGVEEELAHKGEIGGVAVWETVLGNGGEKLAEDVIDVDSGEEFAGRRFGNGGADGFGFEELSLGAGVEEAEG